MMCSTNRCSRMTDADTRGDYLVQVWHPFPLLLPLVEENKKRSVRIAGAEERSCRNPVRRRCSRSDGVREGLCNGYVRGWCWCANRSVLSRTQLHNLN